MVGRLLTSPCRWTTKAAVRSGLFALAYSAAVLLGRQTILPSTGYALVWPAAGVAALWFIAQRRVATVVWDSLLVVASTVVLNALSGAPLPMCVGFAAANLVLALSFRNCFGRWRPQLWGGGGDRALDRLGDVNVLLGSALGAAVCSALVGPVAMQVLGVAQESWWAVGNWVVRNTVSIVLVVAAGQRWAVATAARRTGLAPALPSLPAAMLGMSARSSRPLSRRVEAAAAVGTSWGLYLAVFTLADHLPLAFLPLTLLVWVGNRARTLTVLVHDIGVAAVVVTATVAGHGPFTLVQDWALRGLFAQTYTIGVTIVALVLAVGRDERVQLLRTANARAAEAVEVARQSQVLAEATRQVATAEDARDAICRAAADITGADGVYLLEARDGQLLTTCVVGVDLPPVTIDVEAERSITARCYRRQESLFLPDVRQDPEFSARLVEQLGVVSAGWFPVVRQDQGVGVIGVIWQQQVPTLAPVVTSMLATLASEATVAMERADLLARLAQAAQHDELTGLVNRRRWDEIAAAEVARAARTRTPLTLLLLDLDHFKRFNDTHGHLEGDGLLREFAAAATTCLREVDTLARWGGEEFVVALPECGLQDALGVADRIRAVVPRGQTCTVGVAAWGPGETHEQVLARADAALYAGKAGGRDRSIVADDALGTQAAVQVALVEG